MKLTTWNVNGLRTTPLTPHLASLSSDIICIQETRISGPNDPELESLALLPNHTSYFSIPHTRGYSGVATYTTHKSTPVAADEGLGNLAGGGIIAAPPSSSSGDSTADDAETPGPGYSQDTLDMILREGRCVITDHGAFVLLNLYIPAVSVQGRLSFKRSFLCALREKIHALRAAGRAVILAGDFNIVPDSLDTAEPIPPTQLAVWQAQPSRVWLRELLADGFVDVFRHLYPGRRGAYTCWSTATRGRVNNFGVRIDLILVDESLVGYVRAVEVLQHVEGSDHCPVRVEIDVEVDVGEVPPPFCTAFMKRFAYRQKTLTGMFGRDGKGSNGGVRPRTSEEVGKEGLVRKRVGKRPRTQAKLSTFFTRKTVSELPTTEPPAETRQESPPPEPPLSESLEALVEESHRAAKKRRAAAKAWKKILTGPPPAPLCRHGIPAVLKTVGKSGENRGRTFYSCPYPAGIGKTADCKFFKWAPYKAGLHTS